MNIRSFLENGKVFDAKVLSITSAKVLDFFQAGTKNLTCISLATGYVIEPAVPHMIINGFKNLAGAAMSANYDFKQLAALKAAAAAGPAPAKAAAGAPAAPAKVEKAPEPEEDVDMGGMFGDDGY